jgi:hypothetical protein
LTKEGKNRFVQVVENDKKKNKKAKRKMPGYISSMQLRINAI